MRENYGPGGFSDQYDNGHMRSVDDDQNPGGVTDTDTYFEDDLDLLSDQFNAQHGERYNRYARMEPGRDEDLGRGDGGAEWAEEEIPMDNLARSDLRPDLHPEDKRFYGLGPKGWKRSDARILDEVCHALKQSTVVDPTNLDVRVEDGLVYLEGSLASKGMRRVAEDLVDSVPGVVDVFTKIRVQDK